MATSTQPGLPRRPFLAGFVIGLALCVWLQTAGPAVDDGVVPANVSLPWLEAAIDT
jgi:hypothetical protein